MYDTAAATDDFRRGGGRQPGSISENYRRCGKPNCVCAQPGHPGHGPRYLWARTVAGRGTKGRQLSADELKKVRGELANYPRFAAVSEQIVAVNEAICEARPPNADATVAPTAGTGGRNGGPRYQVAAEFAAEVARLSEVPVASLASSGDGLEAVETAIRTAMLRLGGSLLHRLLAADAGHRGPPHRLRQRPSGRVRVLPSQADQTMLGPGSVWRAYYHCAQCGRGVVPRDDELGAAGASLSPGCAR